MPDGTPIFDAASWNGIAIDSTCGGHGTCKKCKVRVVEGERAALLGRPARVHARRAARRLAARLPRAVARDAGDRGPAAADAAEGGAGRRRPPRDPAPVGAEAPRGARGADDGGPALGLRARLRTRSRTSSRTPGWRCCATSGAVLRRANFDVTAVVCDDELIASSRGTRPRAASRSRSTSGRRRSSPRCSTWRRARRRRCVDAQPPAAVRRRRDHAHLGDDDGRGGARAAAAARAGDDGAARRTRCARRRAWTRARSTRSPSAAT